MTKRMVRLLLLSALTVSCSGEGQDEASSETNAARPPEVAAPTVSILAPIEGSFQEETEVTVRLGSTVSILPAGDMTPGTGHHHLYLDADLGDMTAPIPSVPGSIIHMGDASREYTFENVSSGAHRLLAVVADGAHIPLQPLVVDTVNFVVE